jgi:hypothetical protein
VGSLQVWAIIVPALATVVGVLLVWHGTRGQTRVQRDTGLLSGYGAFVDDLQVELARLRAELAEARVEIAELRRENRQLQQALAGVGIRIDESGVSQP